MPIPPLERSLYLPGDFKFFVVCANTSCGKQGLLYVAIEDNRFTRSVAESTVMGHSRGLGHSVVLVELKKEAGNAAISDQLAYLDAYPFRYLKIWEKLPPKDG